MDELNTKIKSIKTEKTLKVRPENIKSGVNIFGINGSVTELNGETKTVTPTTSSQTITPTGTGKNALTSVTVNAVTSAIDNNITAGNIKNGVTILGVQGSYEGTDTSDATATAEDILEGKTAYVNGQKLTGTFKPYKELDYLESTGAQYIDTGIAPYKTKLEVSFQLTNLTPATSGQGVIASVWNPDDNRYYAGQFQMSSYADARKFICNDRTNNTIELGLADLNVHTIIYNNENNKVLFDNVEKGNIPDLTVQTERNIFLFGFNTSRGPESFFTGKIFYCKIWNKDNNTLLRDFIPVKDLSGIGCMYDKVEGKFYYNQGTGNFTIPYTSLKYIESTGTQYITTDYVPNPNTGYEITYMCGTTNTYEGLFGYSNYGVTPDLRYTVLNDYNYPNNLRIRVKSSNDDNGYVIPATYNEPHTFLVDKNGNYNMDGTTTGQMEGFEASNTSPIYIFGIRQANAGVGNLGNFKIYQFKIFENDTLVHYFIPVKRTSNNAICMYDKITKTFYTNAGSGTFTAGPEI